jgi:riboflavin biosynthesis pyrimidine reductase
VRVFACMASTLDGKIGPANVEQFVSIGSRYDLDHLKSLRDTADGVLFGASTFRAWPKVHHGHKADHQLHHFILSHSLDLDPNADLFQRTDIPVSIFTGAKPSLFLKEFPAQVKFIHLNNQKSTIVQTVDHIKQQGVTNLLVEGGGQVLQQLIEAQILQELFLTVTPKVMGQVDAPNLFGNMSTIKPPVFKTIDSKIVGDEVYFHFLLQY